MADKIVPTVLGGIEVEVVPEDIDDIEPEYKRSLARFLALGAKDRARLERRILEYREQILRLCPDLKFEKIEVPENIWTAVEIKGVGVTKDSSGSVYVRVFGECDWDPEHGLQISYRNGSDLMRVGPEDGHLT